MCATYGCGHVQQCFSKPHDRDECEQKSHKHKVCLDCWVRPPSPLPTPKWAEVKNPFAIQEGMRFLNEHADIVENVFEASSDEDDEDEEDIRDSFGENLGEKTIFHLEQYDEK
ncbi:MAG: hypothetical protein M1834_001142 [Cirrosporium novae-zelandiae]|nr:MAG: hypothetical protein M1834_001142 [Cirrosporium novae-zelandiae]